MRLQLLLLLFLINALSFAQTIPAHRLTDFSRVGAQHSILDTAQVISIDSLLNANLNVDLSTLINDLIDGTVNPLILRFGSKSYELNSKLRLRSNIALVGTGALTSLVINTTDRNGIEIQGKKKASSIELNTHLQKGQDRLQFSNIKNIEPGQTYLLQSNDSDLITSSWALGSTGQLLTIKEIKSDTVYFLEQFTRTHYIQSKPKLTQILPVENVSIAHLTIKRTKEVEGQGSSIWLQYAKDCRINCVRFYNADFAHISLNYSANNTVEGSYFQDAFNYGGGGNAYGVVVQFASGSNLIYNNIFKHLRHSMLLQAGANGNAMAYNYSTDPFWTETWLPSSSAGDLVLHGNYVYSNLLEGNCVQNIVIDASHGKNGGHNIFLRNRAEDYGLFIDPTLPSDSQLFIGNEITNKKGNALYLVAGKGHVEYGNLVKGVITPNGTEDVQLTTLLPIYLRENSQVHQGENYFNTAEKRFATNLETACDKRSARTQQILKKQLVVYPNPTAKYLTISGLDNINTIELMNSCGQIVLQASKNATINVDELPPGFYLLKVYDGENLYTHKIFIE